MKKLINFSHKLWILLVLACGLACGGGGAPGSGLAGPAPSLDRPAGSFQAAAPVGGDDLANVPMPDIAVGPSTDIVIDKLGQKTAWRIFGGGLAICVTTEDPFAVLGPKQDFFNKRWTLLPGLFLSPAHASNEPPSSTSSGNTGTTTTTFNPFVEVTYTHFLKVSLHGQIQYKIDDGEFQNWRSDNFEGERHLRFITPNKTYRDALISPDGKIEIPFVFSFTSPPTLDKFLWQMDHLVAYRTSASEELNAKTEQKKCPPNSVCPFLKYSHPMGAIVPDMPQYGAQPDFTSLPDCSTQ